MTRARLATAAAAAAVTATLATTLTAGTTAPAAADPPADPIWDIRTYSDRWFVPTVENGLTTVRKRANADASTLWEFWTVKKGTRIVTDLNEGVATCLTVNPDRSLGLNTCGDFPRRQRFQITELDSPRQVSIRSVRGRLYEDDGHVVRAGGHPDNPAIVFTLY